MTGLSTLAQPPGVARQVLLFTGRQLRRIRHTPEQMLDVIAQPVLFTLLFTYLFGGAIAGGAQEYLPFLVPGILVQSSLTATAATGVQLREDMSSGLFDRVRSLPVAPVAALAGALVVDALRYAVAAAMTFGVALALGYRPAGDGPAIVIASILVVGVSWASSWGFAWVGLAARSGELVQAISIFVLYPMTLLSNAFVPTDSLPDWLRAFVAVNPVTHLVSACRALLDGHGMTADFIVSVGIAGAAVALFGPLAARAYSRAR